LNIIQNIKNKNKNYRPKRVPSDKSKLMTYIQIQ
jgi:hypothetical protein